MPWRHTGDIVTYRVFHRQRKIFSDGPHDLSASEGHSTTCFFVQHKDSIRLMPSTVTLVRIHHARTMHVHFTPAIAKAACEILSARTTSSFVRSLVASQGSASPQHYRTCTYFRAVAVEVHCPGRPWQARKRSPLAAAANLLTLLA